MLRDAGHPFARTIHAKLPVALAMTRVGSGDTRAQQPVVGAVQIHLPTALGHTVSRRDLPTKMTLAIGSFALRIDTADGIWWTLTVVTSTTSPDAAIAMAASTSTRPVVMRVTSFRISPYFLLLWVRSRHRSVSTCPELGFSGVGDRQCIALDSSNGHLSST
jgi:hypothetical protein